MVDYVQLVFTAMAMNEWMNEHVSATLELGNLMMRIRIDQSSLWYVRGYDIEMKMTSLFVMLELVWYDDDDDDTLASWNRKARIEEAVISVSSLVPLLFWMIIILMM